MKPLQLLFQSSIGKKVIMGATGALLFLFVIGHLVGNLQIFLPKERINAYGHLLHANAGLLWVVRLSLLAIIGLHVWSAITLNAQNKSARPEVYAGAAGPYGASWASRYMFMTGLVIAAFVVYHLLHFTLQAPAINFLPANHEAKDFTQLVVTSGPQQGYRDVHRMLVAGFQQPIVTIFYLVAVGLLSLHLSHGTQAMFQSLGMQEGVWRRRLEAGSKILAGLIFAGYAIIPLAVFLRLVQ
ncbi:MAG: succinate dehydrogenase cytochrome b subunit [Verrucomicrobiales bacterium]|nr:succinate dehydrogenase cytochrome b subunit [Verrucomicrobiales bacterium]